MMVPSEVARQLGFLPPVPRLRCNGAVVDQDEWMVFSPTPRNAHPLFSPDDDHFYVELQVRSGKGSGQLFRITVEEIDKHPEEEGEQSADLYVAIDGNGEANARS